MKRFFSLIIVLIMLANLFVSGGIMHISAAEIDKTTDFVTSNVDIDELLRRDYIDNVPLGYNEDIFSLYQPGWGFDRTDIYRTGVATGWGMPVTVSVDGNAVSVTSAEFIPSYVTSVGADASGNVSITGYKYISQDNRAIVIISAENKGESDVQVQITATTDVAVANENVLSGTAADFPVVVEGSEGFAADNNALTKTVTIAPGATEEFRIAMSMTEVSADAFFADSNPLATQKQTFNKWFTGNIPYLDVPDEQIKQIYYFRWYTYRNHIRMTTDDYYIISEFLPNVSWAGLHNGISCPSGLHVAEGRWLRNSDYLDDYLFYWMKCDSSIKYSTWLANAYYERYLVNQDTAVLDYIDDFKRVYEDWINKRYNDGMGLYWQYAGYDGMELAVGGDGYRPTINAYQYADAMAISEMCKMLGDTEGAKYYAQEAQAIKTTMDEKLWDESDSFYKMIRLNQTDTIDPQEQFGYVPWMFNMPDDTEEKGRAWTYLMSEDGFFSEYGPRTAELQYAARYPTSNYGKTPCRWNGPSWPFATTQTLVGMSNLLNDYNNQTAVDKDDYFTILKTYTKSQYKNGAPWISENLDADNGTWIVDIERSPNYNHSEYANLIITGLMGIRPDNGKLLTVNPLVPDDWEYFCIENVPYHGHFITVLYDKDGSHYGQGAGYKIYVDGQCYKDKTSVGEATVALFDSPDKLNFAYALSLIKDVSKGNANSEADINNDGKVDLVDVIKCLRYTAQQ